MSQLKENRLLFSLPPTIWAIGIVTLLMNMSTVIIFTLSPIYLTTILGVSIAGVGTLEGIVESLAWFTRFFSGAISDYIHKRKPLLIAACGLTVLARPLFAMARNIEMIFIARSLDRIGNGLQATPREALVGDAAPRHLKGTSFGLRQALSVLGSLLGALLIFFWHPQEPSSYSYIFWIASLPPLIGFLVLLVFVKDYTHPTLRAKRESLKEVLYRCLHLNQGYWRVVATAFIFMISNYSGAFMILRVTEASQDISLVALVMIAQNLTAMIFAYSLGRLSDRIDRRLILAFGFFLTILSNSCFAYDGGIFWNLLGASLWGGQLGAVQSLIMTKIADHTSQDLRATAFGVYYVLIAFSVLIGNKVMGYFYGTWGPSWGFNVSSCVVLVALLTLPFMKAPAKLKH